jgi:peptide/nickel transport system permease protein
MRSVDAPDLDAAARFLDALRRAVLPCLALALPPAGGIALYVRDQVEAALARGHVRAARARGLTRRRVLVRHALRSVLLPVVNLFGLALPGIVGGSVVVETLFAWPGMGRLAYQAVLARDEPLILGCACAGTAAVILGSLLADLAGAALHPRVREEVP